MPVGLGGIVAGVLQGFHEDGFRGVGTVGGELAHTVGLAAVGVLVGYGQHLVGLQRGAQGDIAQGLVHRIFRTAQQAGGSQLLVVLAALEGGGKHRAGLVDVAGGGVGRRQLGILVVGIVLGHLRRRAAPTPFRGGTLAEVGKGHDVAGVRRRAGLVGHPHLDTGDVHAGGQVGQLLHGGIVTLTEIARQEEVAVLFVVGHVQFEGCQLRAALAGDALRGGVLLRQHGLQLQLAELHVGAHAEEAGGSLDQRVVRREGDVAGLDELDDFVFLALVAQLQVLGVEVEGGIGVVVQRHVHLVAYLAGDVEVDFLVEIDRLGVTVALGQRRVVDVLEVGTELQLCGTLGLDAHTARAEYLLGGADVEVHVGKVEFLLAFVRHVLGILLAEELVHLAALAPLVILFGGHQHRGIQVAVTNLRANDVHAGRVVVLYLLLDILGEVQVEGRRVEVGHLDGGRLLYLPAGAHEGVGRLWLFHSLSKGLL